jgi:hypothetical protein
MDIYILRHEKQIGPFSDDATQTLLRQGTISAADLAWRPGLSGWQPLGVVLKSLSVPSPIGANQPPPVPATVPVELATSQQVALLNHLAIPLPGNLSKADAEDLIAKASEEPGNAARFTRWSQDRLRLHPELFAEEIAAKKIDRVQYYLECCEAEGAEYFNGVTKAHCQVLVAFLDVKFPRWDARDTGAMEAYFFPAIAEKFPQLVNKSWRGKFQYLEGPGGSGTTRKSPTSKLVRPAVSPIAAIFRGLVLGLIILAILYAVHRAMQHGRFRGFTSENPPASGTISCRPTSTPPCWAAGRLACRTTFTA